MKRFLMSITVCLGMQATVASAYPLDAAPETGIERLEGYRQAQLNQGYGWLLPRGAQLPTAQVRLRLQARPDLQLPTADERFSAEIVSLLQELSGGNADDFGIAVLDLTDIEHPVYAEHRATLPFNPGSVGKLAVAMGVFQALADIWPNDIEARRKLLRQTIVTADEFIQSDHHVIPTWDGERLHSHRIQIGDRANLWTWLDWMLSASSNAAASTVMKQMMLLSHYKQSYPVDEATGRDFFSRTSRDKLGELLAASIQKGLDGSGIDAAGFRQGKFFTRTGKSRVPGLSSHATPRELMKFLMHLEQGKLVDTFSSLEIKRLLYITQRRIRYASSPALDDAAVFFKSGSYYRCSSEPGFHCGKYKGNVSNLLNSVAIVESPAGDPNGLFYMVVMTSNVLKQNAALLHQDIGTGLQRLIESRHPGR